MRNATDPRPSLDDTSWEVRWIGDGREGVASLLSGTRITLEFGNGRVSGSAGCNRYTAAYVASAGALEISAVASTRMACPEPVGIMEQEAAFLSALASTATWSMSPTALILETAEGETAIQCLQAETRPPDDPPDGGDLGGL